jgi:hypothetical protein
MREGSRRRKQLCGSLVKIVTKKASMEELPVRFVGQMQKFSDLIPEMLMARVAARTLSWIACVDFILTAIVPLGSLKGKPPRKFPGRTS